MAVNEIDIIKKQSKRLAPKQKLELIDFLSKSLYRSSQKPTALQFGKYSAAAGRKSTAEDFRIAEWHPTDLDLNGN